MARSNSHQALVLFDIDGTLVRRAGPEHREALVAAVWEVLRVRTRNDNIPVHGMLDSDILMQMMINAGIAPRRGRAALPAIYRAAERYYFCTVQDLRKKVCPGIPALLETLRGWGAVLGLVTGNLTRIGWKKLERADLADYFHFGAFGEMAATRGELVELAVAHARQHGWVNGHSRGLVVGDTPHDVAAGQAHGLDTLAIATGLSSLEELQAAGPSLCAPDLTHASVGKWLGGVLGPRSVRSGR
jgi:phosphoglycolate phosphatase